MPNNTQTGPTVHFSFESTCAEPVSQSTTESQTAQTVQEPITKNKQTSQLQRLRSRLKARQGKVDEEARKKIERNKESAKLCINEIHHELSKVPRAPVRLEDECSPKARKNPRYLSQRLLLVSQDSTWASDPIQQQ